MFFKKTTYLLLPSFYEKHFKTKGGKKVILAFRTVISRENGERLCTRTLTAMCAHTRALETSLIFQVT